MPAERFNVHVVGTIFQILPNSKFKRSLALKIFEESQRFQVKHLCFKILKFDDLTSIIDKTETKNFTLSLLKESKNQDILIKCLNLLSGEPETKIVAKILLQESKFSNVIMKCLGLLQEEPETKIVAKKLLQESNSSDIIMKCLNLLYDDPETINIAKKMISEFDEPNVKSKCLRILMDHNDLVSGKEFSLSVIKNWRTQDPSLVARCLSYVPNLPESIEAMQTILRGRIKYGILYYYILKNGYGVHDFWVRKNREIILKWKNENREILGWCLDNLESEPELSKQCCLEILQNWESELNIVKKNIAKNRYFEVSDAFLIKSLTHPSLNAYALSIVRSMFKREQAQLGYLTPNLRKLVYDVMQSGVLPEWNT